MIRRYFRVIYITIEKIVIGNTQPTHEVPGKSPEGLLKMQDLQRTFRGLLGDNTKIDDFMKKIFSEVIVLVLYICFCFIEEEQIFRSSKRVCPRDACGTQLRDVLGTK